MPNSQKTKSCDAVRNFLSLVGLLSKGGDKPAKKAFDAALKSSRAEREELLFRTEGALIREKRRFIEFNNEVVRRDLEKHPPRKALLLVPFCLQSRQCPHQIAWHIENCKLCGKCPIGPIRKVCKEFGIEARLTLRSRLAPEFVRESAPDLVIAVACEQELVAGILRVAPCRCYGIINERPEGYCKNTRVAVERIADFAREYLNGKD
jgi:uncharacterized protein